MTSARLSPRLRLLHKALSLGHRFPRRRFFTMSLSLLLLATAPLLGWARVDLYSGRHRVLGEPATWPQALGAVCIGFGVLVSVTFLFNFVGGRLFCGWGCPVGQISRFGEIVETASVQGRGRLRALVEGALFSAALALALMLWWTHPAAFVSSSPTALVSTHGTLAVLVALAFWHGRSWRWGFCRTACPIGLYYSVVSPSTSYGIVFEPQMKTCIDCDACARICPVRLDPRKLTASMSDIGGLALSGLPADNHCLRCGDCVGACELVLRQRTRQEIPLHFGLGVKGSPVRPRKEIHEQEA
jgi:ferredoxin-type protein NapH